MTHPLEVAQAHRLAQELWSSPPEALVYDFKIDQHDPGLSSEVLPVLICARNEEDSLPATLASLALNTNRVHPVVVSSSTDRTSEFAEAMGATVLEEGRNGKLVAYQTGALFIEAEFETPLFAALDADSIANKFWAQRMHQRLGKFSQTDGGHIAGGLVSVVYGQSRTTDALRTALLNAKQVLSCTGQVLPGARGANHGWRFGSNGQVSEAIHTVDATTFPGEDKALKDQYLQLGGIVVADIHPYSLVVTKGDRFSSLAAYINALRGITSPESLYETSSTNLIPYRRGGDPGG